jgi:putative ABC transport system permease protein
MGTLGLDLRYAARQLVKSPGFTLTAVLSLAIGLGANVSVFSVAQTLLWRPLSGIAEPERLVDIGRTDDGSGFDTMGYPDFLDYQAGAKSLSHVFAFEPQSFYVGISGSTQRAMGFSASREYFDALGVRPAHGRFFLPEEDRQAGGAPVAVVSHDFFERRLGGDPRAVGRSILVNSLPFTVVGVTPPDFHGHIVLLSPEIWVPITARLSSRPNELERLSGRGWSWLILGGRLADNASLGQARAELATVAARLKREFPESHSRRGVAVLPARPVPAPGRNPAKALSILLFALVGLVLLIACVNVASMLLARFEARRRELSVRQSLGATQARLVCQLLVEAVLLFAVAAGPALLLARWGVDLLSGFRPPTPFPLRLDFPIDYRVLAFGAVLAVVTGLLFGLGPALRASRHDPIAGLRDGLGTSRSRPLRLRRALVAAQLGLSLVLLSAAGLLLRGLGTAHRIDPGFDGRGVTAVEVDLDLAGYDDVRARALLEEAARRVSRLPGIEAVTGARVVPLDFTRLGFGPIAAPGIEGIGADANVVLPGLFAALRMPLTGRDFSPGDGADSRRVAIVNEALARQLWPGGSALGRTFYWPSQKDRPFEVIGVARDSRTRSLLDPPGPFYWIPASQHNALHMNLLVRAGAHSAAVPSAVAGVLRDLDPHVPPGPPRLLDDVAAMATLPQRLSASVAGSLGLVGLLLAALGLYGVVTYGVVTRTRELAVRLALGARRRQIVAFVLRDAARPLVVGVGAGLVLSVGAGWLLRGFLFDLSPVDPWTFVSVSLLLGGVALLSAALPARRAATLDPMTSLRSE